MKTPKNELNDLLAQTDGVEREALLQTWELVGHAKPPAPMDPDRTEGLRKSLREAVRDRTAHAGLDGSERETARRPRGPLVFRIRLVAAAVITVFVVAAGVWGFLPKSYLGAEGGNLVVTHVLRDGAQVQLAPGARLTGGARFSARRSYALDGEAWFEVDFNPDRPFSVETAHAEITVLGTSFAVRDWSSGVRQETSVFLKSGSISLRNTASDSTITMEPGVSFRSSLDGLKESQAYGEVTATAWTSGDLHFQAEPLGYVLDDVSRRFNVDISWTSAVDADRPVSGVFRAPDEVEVVLRDLAAYMSVMYRPTATGFELYAPD
ncbi:MAG: hypothetical protein HKN29_05020 [Rhodothermales bacterium]|nr:hypothetical protein [Rhodothermales bacterium]